ALLRRPDVLLVDEPTAALDRATSSAVLASLERASAAGAAVLVATHEADVIARCDSVLTLSDTG
ncbi:ABC transporter ATP-binding protein, partial [Dietzia sp. DQ11-44]|nr:ABC transporter ATP-binding protein [Dietzia sp. DQ11-44]